MKRTEQSIIDLKNILEVNSDKKAFIISFFEDAGYLAIAEEIKNNRNPKENALVGLRLYIKQKKLCLNNSDESMEQLIRFNEAMISLINEVIQDNTLAQKEYLKLKLNYDNAVHTYYEKLMRLDNLIDTLDNSKESELKLQQYNNEVNVLEGIQRQHKDILDAFILNKL